MGIARSSAVMGMIITTWGVYYTTGVHVTLRLRLPPASLSLFSLAICYVSLTSLHAVRVSRLGLVLALPHLAEGLELAAAVVRRPLVVLEDLGRAPAFDKALGARQGLGRRVLLLHQRRDQRCRTRWTGRGNRVCSGATGRHV